MHKVTSLEIAELAGVSQSTVSRALRKSPLVNPDTRRRIQRIAREHNYKVDRSASTLRSQDSRTIAMLVHEESGMDSDINPFFVSMLASITRAAAARNYDVLLSFQQLSKNWIVDYENSNKAEGIILLGYGGYTDYIRKIELLDDAHVLTWGPVIEGQPGHFVGCDNRRGGYLATRYLLELGHTRIAYLGDISDDCPEFQDRYRGHRAALRQAGLREDPRLQASSLSSTHTGHLAARQLIARGEDFSAVFCCSDLTALGAIHALQEQGLSVPGDVSVVGFDNIPSATHMSPALTTIRQNTVKAGEVMVDTLLRLIRGDYVESQLVQPELIVRESCGPRRTETSDPVRLDTTGQGKRSKLA